MRQLALGILLISTIACEHSPTGPAVPTTVSVAIVSMSPDPSTPLSAGSTVTFTGKIAYSLASVATGEVVIVIEDQGFHNLSTNPQPTVNVSRGSGMVTLSDSVIIPASGTSRVFVFFPLAATGSTNSLVAQSVTYTVR